MNRPTPHSSAWATGGVMGATVLAAGISGIAANEAIAISKPDAWRPIEGELVLPTGVRITRGG